MNHTSDEEDGDVVGLARFVFNEQRQSGRVVIIENRPETAAALFNLLCDLYICGAKIFNGMDPSDQIQQMADLRSSTLEFLRERMIHAFSIEPTLEFVQPDVTAEARYRFLLDDNDMTRSRLDDQLLGTRLSFKYTRT